jgi:hypothetical protein
MIGGPFQLLVEVAKLVEADLDRKISGRSFENRGRGRIGFDSHSPTTNHEGEKDG